MNLSILKQVGILFGLIVTVAGVVFAFITGFDLVYGSIGAVTAGVGVLLSWWCRRGSPTPAPEDHIDAPGQRSIQRPDTAAKPSKSKIDRRI